LVLVGAVAGAATLTAERCSSESVMLFLVGRDFFAAFDEMSGADLSLTLFGFIGAYYEL
jgi:hypothetical protein